MLSVVAPNKDLLKVIIKIWMLWMPVVRIIMPRQVGKVAAVFCQISQWQLIRSMHYFFSFPPPTLRLGHRKVGQNIRLGWKFSPGGNTLAYFAGALTTANKFFKVLHRVAQEVRGSPHLRCPTLWRSRPRRRPGPTETWEGFQKRLRII